ncbi:MAG: Ig-like domain-containing protein [Tannerella sp.]|nr:Ig-like domain-containing protein [Tannerella sp.]
MKKGILLLISYLFFGTSAMADEPVTGVALDKSTVRLVVGASETLTATVSPDNAAIKTVTWSSNAEGVAKVDRTGNVTAVSAGTATVTVTTDDQGKTATCTVEVTDSVHVTKIALDKTNLELHVDSVTAIKAVIEPDTATDKSMTFSNSDPSVVEITTATITTNGGVCGIKAKSPGTAKIVVTAADGGITDTCTVTVPPVALTDLQLKDNIVSLGISDSIRLEYILTPANTTQKGISWTSGNPNIVTVSESGTVKAKTTGKAYIYAESTIVPDLKDSCLIEVTIKVIRVSIKDSISIIEGDSEQLTVDIFPANAANKNVTWTIEDASVAYISPAGLITGVKVGKTYVCVTAEGDIKDFCIVNVREKVIISDPPTATARNGSFPLSIKTPDNGTFTGEFVITFPERIVLDAANTNLVPAYKQQDLSLKISGAGTNAWKIEIIPESLRSATLRAGSGQQIMDIAYTIDKSKPNGTYNITVSNAVFKFSNGTEIREEKMAVPLTVRINGTNNTDLIDNGNAQVYAANSRLFVQSASAETIHIYSFNGTLLYTNAKEAGKAAFDLNIQEPAFIVKGSSGWTKKIVK